MSLLQISLLAYAAMIDIASRLIPNCICAAVAIAAIIAGANRAPYDIALSLIAAFALFLVLFLAHGRGWIGGGDVKLLVALALGMSLTYQMRFLFITSVAGVALAFVHLAMRDLPRPTLPPLGSSILRRVYAIERWRILRRAPLPYGVAIACGGIWTIVTMGA